MTINDISRLLKLAHVPHSKTVQVGYPHPFIDVHVPATHYPVVMEVVKRIALPTDNIRVSLLASRDVRSNEHVYVKVSGGNRLSPRDCTAETAWAYNRRRQQQNRNVVVECASVVAL
jgi:hypothetical protein